MIGPRCVSKISIGKLSRTLIYLGLGNNNLIQIPKEIGQLTSLYRLDLDNNDLTTLPESLIQLKALEELRLYGNSSLSLPGWLDAFKSRCKITAEK